MKKIITLLLASLFLYTAAKPQTQQEKDLMNNLLKDIEIDVTDRRLTDVLSLISEKADIRITYSNIRDVRLIQVPRLSLASTCENILEELLDNYDLTYVPQPDGSIELSNTLQNSKISGQIIDANSGSPLVFANVFFEDTQIGTTTDNDGMFNLERIPRNIYQLHIQYMGYKAQTFRFNLQRGKNIYLRILLEPDVLEMQALQVTAAPSEEVIHKTEISSFTIRQRQLEIMPNMGDEDVFQTIQMLPGITMTSEYKSQFYIRGGNSDQNLVLMDGGILYNPFHFSGILSSFDTDAIDQLDVYAGGFNAEYGGRLSSVVDVQSRGGGDQYKGKLNISPISFKLLIEIPDQKRWISQLFSFRRSFVNAISKRIGDRVEPDFYDGIVHVDIHPPIKTRFTFSGFISGDKVILQDGDNENPMKSDNRLVAANIERLQSEDLHLNFNLSLGSFKSTIPPPQGISQAAENKLTDVSSTLKIEWQLFNALQVIGGMEYRTLNVKYQSSDYVTTKLNIHKKTYEKAFFLQYLLKISDSWELENGIRFQSYNPHKPMINEPRFSLRYRIYNVFSFKASYGRFSQNLVTIYNENDTYNPIDIWLPPDSNMDYATADHYIFGFDYKTGRFNLITEIYWKQYQNLTHYNRERLDADDPFFLQGDGKAIGLDLSFQIFHDRWQVWGSYSLGKATKKLPFQYPESRVVEFAPRYDQRHSITLLVTALPWRKLEFSMKFVLGSGLPFTHVSQYYQRLPGWAINPTSDYVYDDDITENDYIVGIKSEINAYRFPTYHRLDMSVKYSFEWKRYLVQPYLSFLNLYNQKNVLYYDASGTPHWSIHFLPTIGVDIEF